MYRTVSAIFIRAAACTVLLCPFPAGGQSTPLSDAPIPAHQSGECRPLSASLTAGPLPAPAADYSLEPGVTSLSWSAIPAAIE